MSDAEKGQRELEVPPQTSPAINENEALKVPEEPKRSKAKAPEVEEEENVVEEKLICINLRHAYLTYGRKATPKAIRLVKKAASKAFKAEEGEVKLSSSVNEALWRRGKVCTERRIALRVQRLESGVVRVLKAEA